MDFVKLNKERHAVKSFDGKKVPTIDIKQIISAASLAPSANNIQSWHFVIAESEEAIKKLASLAPEGNAQQILTAGAVVVLFSDTALAERSREIAKQGNEELTDDMLSYFNSILPGRYDDFDEIREENYLGINAGLVAMNLTYAIYNRGYVGNIIMGFDRSEVANEALEVDKRYKAELIFTFGSSEDKGTASYRLPQEEIIEIR
ncbi:nitroreductase family protein [Lactococcus termiticola]|uniref:Nitroreductase n=1 Tax=Lactococcus termiticola TaxID=2169526 RepID=A0A2R5HES9_9LACT|nr:nitroreductase family protein [Lactococcus termiticola]GBG96574.1 nitroreductase [Lactococcus termiticola]